MKYYRNFFSLMNITIVLKFIFIIDAFREYNSRLPGYYKLKYYHQTEILHRCSYKIITIIKILQCFKLTPPLYVNLLF